MLNMFKKSPILILCISVCIIAIIFYVSGDAGSQKIITNNDLSQANTPTHDHPDQKTATVATQWQWSQIKEQATAKQIQQKKLPFTPKFVYEALKAVKLDENGNVIYDHNALLSLDEALLRMQSKLDIESLAILQSIIKDGLPGKAGEQTANIVANYYHYLEAKDEFSRTSETLADTSVHQSVKAIENDEQLYSELQALRGVHLGHDVTSGLFRVTDADAEYMFASMKLDFDESLSEEEKEIKRREIQEKHTQHAINITNWPERYAAFQQRKQNILTAKLNKEETQAQLTDLLNSHFSQDEQKRITHLGLDQL